MTSKSQIGRLGDRLKKGTISEVALHKTHGRYFKSLAELTRLPGNTGNKTDMGVYRLTPHLLVAIMNLQNLNA